jgi:formylglycine-generating enzyme required for sulfatase activity
MKLAANYLKRSGYRLPTEAEIEFATRAGSVTSRCYGETEELLPKYAWYNKNGQDRSWPVGSKKPNDLGLFDVHGNVFTWCQERFKADPNSKEKEVADDHEETRTITLEYRGLRGGSFAVYPSIVRSAFRQGVVPTYRSDGDVGLRPARTLPP